MASESVQIEQRRLHQEFADVIATRIGQLSAGESETTPSPEQIQPEYGFLDVLYDQSGKIIKYGTLPDNPDEIVEIEWASAAEAADTPDFINTLRHAAWNAVLLSKKADRFSNYKEHSGSELQALLASLSTNRKIMSSFDSAVDVTAAINRTAYLAAYTKPSEIAEPLRPKKHKDETEDEQVYRTAMRDLVNVWYRLRDNPYTKLYKKWDSSFSDNDDKYGIIEKALTTIKTPEMDDIRTGFANHHLHGTVSRYLNAIADKEFTSDGFRDDLFRATLDYKAKADNDTDPEVDYKETTWTILPPGTLEEIEETGESNTDGETRNFVDPERMKWLARLAISWSPEAYIAIANLDATGNYDYRVAILPQEVNGVAIEHGVAENPASGNAIYAFRAETGIDAEEGVFLNWKDVYHETRTHARALGARKILHGKYVEDNVLEYLTRPTEQLTKPGYRR